MAQITCTQFRRAHSDWRDERLPQAQAEAVEAHLRTCERCRRHHKALDFGVRLLRATQPYRVDQEP